MLNPGAFYNSRPDGFAVLEIVDDNADRQRRFVPLQRTELTGTVTGPLATLSLTQTFAIPEPSPSPIEALYRFPLSGDAAVTGVRVRFGTIEIHTALKERKEAEAEYAEAKKSGRQAALVTRESPDVFTLAVAGIRAGENVIVRTDYVQLARPEGSGWSLHVPLTTSPRYVRADEAGGGPGAGSRHADGQPLALLRDPGHRFALDLTLSDADGIACTTHALAVEGGRVRLREGEVVPDRDCIIAWRPQATNSPHLRVWTHADRATDSTYFLALCVPPRGADDVRVPREVILLVDHSGSMEGPKWEAADWAVERFVAGLNQGDALALGLFHSETRWWNERPRQATPEAMQEAVAFLKKHRDAGGTELGVALEQALDRARTSGTSSRHVLVLTDAEVSDAGRILQLAEKESAKPERRRISVLCIDSAPNAALATTLAERGGGVSRFLTSNPNEDDVTTALDEVLADWSAPVLADLTLEVNRTGAEAVGRTIALITPGPASGIDVGDLPGGRPVWVIGRVPRGDGALAFQLRTSTERVASYRCDANETLPGLKALFGADRLRRLEYVMHANYAGEELRGELARLGYETTKVAEAKVYAENTRSASIKIMHDLLVRESLAAGVPCSETAFVAVRNEPGQPVTETHIVANALPHGWSDRFASALGPGRVAGRAYACMLSAPPAASVDSMLCEFDLTLDDEDSDESGSTSASTASGTPMKLSPDMVARLRTASSQGVPRPSQVPQPSPPIAASSPSLAKRAIGAVARLAGLTRTASPPAEIRITITAGQYASADGAVLYDSAKASTSPDATQFAYLSVSFADKSIAADKLDPELTLLLYVGDRASPRAKVKLADMLRQGGRRPLNLRREATEEVCLILADPSKSWAMGIPALEIVLG